MKKLRKFVETDSQEKARLVAAEVRAKQSNMEDDFFEAYESGELDMSNYSGIDGVADWITESSNETDSRSSKEIVIDGITECDEATVENIVAYAESNGVSEEKVMTLLNQMRRHGDVLQKQSGEFRYL
jgi:DNA replicative helicase MCM subunit Mcm2 (Cdc46/Mcm family)